MVPDEDEDFKYDLKRQHVVFCGTEVLQGKNSSGAYCKAVVIRTGKVVLTFYSVRFVTMKLRFQAISPDDRFHDDEGRVGESDFVPPSPGLPVPPGLSQITLRFPHPRTHRDGILHVCLDWKRGNKNVFTTYVIVSRFV